MRSWIGVGALTLIAVASAGARAAKPTLTAPADPICALVSGVCTPPPYVTVMSAFPAEQRPLVDAAQVTETIILAGRTYYVGTLAGVNVILVRGGVGFVNAEATTRAFLDRFQVSTIVFSGVAGSPYDIGDVVAPAQWSDGTSSFPVTPSLFALAQTLTSPPIALEQCTHVPPEPPGPMVCLGRNPQIIAGGTGESSDNFGGAYPCVPGGGPISGCEVPLVARSLAVTAAPPVASDDETAAVARVAQEAGVPFMAFRGVSDGPGDPLNLPGYPTQFYAYYKLSSDNAAAVTTAFLAALKASGAIRTSVAAVAAMSSTRPRIEAACDWELAAGPVCAGVQAPRALTAQVTHACRLLEKRVPAGRLRKAWRSAAKMAKRVPSRRLGPEPDCGQALVTALEARATGQVP
jgi:hypothetical protein